MRTFLQIEGIEHKRTRVKRPQSNGIVERLHRTRLDEHFRVEGRRTWFETIDEMQTVLDLYLVEYNTKRPHQGRGINGRTPIAAFMDGIQKGGCTTAEADKEGRLTLGRRGGICQAITLSVQTGPPPAKPEGRRSRP